MVLHVVHHTVCTSQANQLSKSVEKKQKSSKVIFKNKLACSHKTYIYGVF